MTCAADNPLAVLAYGTRRALYEAAGLDLADKVDSPDRRFAEALEQLGRQHPAVVVAVAARNDLADSVDGSVARPLARAFVVALPVLQLHEAEQEARRGAIRAAELWTPAGGASFATYARRWARKCVGKLADAARAVHRPERARLRGDGIEMCAVPLDLAGSPLDEFLGEENHDDNLQAEQLDKFLGELGPLERKALALRHGFDGFDEHREGAAAAAMGINVASYRATLREGMKQLRCAFAGRPRQTGLF